MRTLPRSALAAAGIWLAACLPEPQPGTPDDAPAIRLPAPAVTAGAHDSLRLELEAPSRVTTGEPVPITLRARNVSGGPLELYLRGRVIAWDLVLEQEDGTVVWQRLHGQIVPAIIQIKVLGPGDTLEFRHDWLQRSNSGRPVPPGRYRLRALLLRDDPEPFRSDSVPVEILPPG